jgi:hypothetical protein
LLKLGSACLLPGVVALVSNESGKNGETKMKRAIVFVLVLLGAFAPVVGMAEAHWDTACQCSEFESP